MKNLRDVVQENLINEIEAWSHLDETQEVTFGYNTDGTVGSELGESWQSGWVSKKTIQPGWFSEDNEELGEDDLAEQVEYMLDEMGL